MAPAITNVLSWTSQHRRSTKVPSNMDAQHGVPVASAERINPANISKNSKWRGNDSSQSTYTGDEHLMLLLTSDHTF
jgi:hypothetical protein